MLSEKDENEASDWFASQIEKSDDARWLVALIHACMEKSLISEWKKDDTIVFTERALDRKAREDALVLAREMYRLVATYSDKTDGAFT